jgi:hypothetical protein
MISAGDLCWLDQPTSRRFKMLAVLEIISAVESWERPVVGPA